MLTNSRTEESNVTWTLLLKCDLFITKCLLECVIGVNVKLSGTHGGEFLWKFSRKFVRMCLSVHFVGNYLVHGVWRVADSHISHFSKYYQYQSSQRTSVKMTDFLPSRPEPSICPSTCQPGNVRRTKNLYPFGTQFQPEFKINCSFVLFPYLSFWFYCWLKCVLSFRFSKF